jgi:hypothetical protein
MQWGRDGTLFHSKPVNGAPAQLVNRLDALMTVVGYCAGGAACTNPYRFLHPDGSVNTFEEAMDPKHDAMYDALRKFEFLRCAIAYNTANERSFFDDLGVKPRSVQG